MLSYLVIINDIIREIMLIRNTRDITTKTIQKIVIITTNIIINTKID